MLAANPLRGEASFAAGDTTYRLDYDMDVFIAAEETSGWDMPALLDRLGRGNLKAFRAMIWAGLQRHHECHLIRTKEIIAEAGVDIVGAAMRKALEGAFGPATSGDPANPLKAASGTGGRGSRAGAPKA